ncbi:DUF1836 domain-containing protein [Clostridium sp. DL1XJH146]
MNNWENLLSHKLVRAEDIPNIDLYMDQVTGYLENTLKKLKVDKEDKILTKTMINNYVKAKVIDKPIKKKYNKNQVMELIMIYHLKNIITLGEIDEMFFLQDLKATEIEKDKVSAENNIIDNEIIEGVYESFLEIQEQVLENINRDYEKNIELITSNDKNEAIKYITKLILEADLNKRLAELILKNMSKK